MRERVKVYVQVTRLPATEEFDEEVELELLDVQLLNPPISDTDSADLNLAAFKPAKKQSSSLKDLFTENQEEPEDPNYLIKWTRDELDGMGLEYALFPDGVPTGKTENYCLLVKGYPWATGPDWQGEYDGGFEVESVEEVDVPADLLSAPSA